MVVGGHEARGPIFSAGNGAAGFVEHDDVAGEVLVDIAEAVVDPASEGGLAADEGTGVHHEHGGAVDGGLGLKGVDKGDIIDALGEMREEGGDLLAALAVLVEVPFGLDDTAFVLFSSASVGFDSDGFAIEALHLWFMIEGIDMGRAAIHKEENDALCFGWKMLLRNAGSEGCCLGFGKEAFFGKHTGEGDLGETSSDSGDEFAAVGAVTERHLNYEI